MIAPAYIAETSRRASAAGWAPAAAGHRDRHLRFAGHRPPAGASGRWGIQRVVAGHGGLALDVPGDGRPGGPLRCAGVHHPRVALLSGCPASHSGGTQGADHAAGEKNLEITLDRIQSTLAGESKPSWRDLRKPAGGIYGIVWVGLGLSIFQQFVGINVIFYYSNVLWQAVGFDESQSFLITVITSIVNIATTLIAIAP